VMLGSHGGRRRLSRGSHRGDRSRDRGSDSAIALTWDDASLLHLEELIARMALREDVRDPGASREWEARINQLQADLIKTADDWAELLPAVEPAKVEIGKLGGATTALTKK
jgi:hypothetical protein